MTQDNFELDFTIWSKSNKCAAADIVPGRGRRIFGVLYKIPRYLICRETARLRNRKSLDEIEGEGTNYERRLVSLLYLDARPLDGKVVTYMVKCRETGLQTSLCYIRRIFAGLREHSAPDEYIEYVKAGIAANNPKLENCIAIL